jgi:hypothetical protein
LPVVQIDYRQHYRQRVFPAMYPSELLVAARDAGLDVRANGHRLIIRGPKSADALARQLLSRKAEVMAALAAGTVAVAPVGAAVTAPVPPPGATIYTQDEHGRPCQPGATYMWTWSGGPTWQRAPTWYYTREHLVPAGHPHG